VYIQTETLNFTFARKAVLHIYIFAWLLLLWQHNVITSPRVTACFCDEANTSETVLHFCTFLINPHFDLEPDYIIRKPMKHSIDIMSVWKYSQLFMHESNTIQYVIPPIQTNGTECAQTHTYKSENIISASSLRSLGGYNNKPPQVVYAAKGQCCRWLFYCQNITNKTVRYGNIFIFCSHYYRIKAIGRVEPGWLALVYRRHWN